MRRCIRTVSAARIARCGRAGASEIPNAFGTENERECRLGTNAGFGADESGIIRRLISIIFLMNKVGLIFIRNPCLSEGRHFFVDLKPRFYYQYGKGGPRTFTKPHLKIEYRSQANLVEDHFMPYFH